MRAYTARRLVGRRPQVFTVSGLHAGSDRVRSGKPSLSYRESTLYRAGYRDSPKRAADPQEAFLFDQ